MVDLDRRLRTLDRVETPDLWEEIERRAAAKGRERPRPVPPRRGLWRPRLGAGEAVAVVVAIAVVVVAATTLLPTRSPSALAIIKSAQEDFAEVPPFRAELTRFVSGEQMLTVAAELFDEFPEYSGEDWVYRHTLWYGGSEGWRREIVADTLPFTQGGKGSFMVFDGNRTGAYYAHDLAGDGVHEGKTFREEAGEDGQHSPLLELSPEPTAGIGKLIQTRAGPGMRFDEYFEERCRVLPDDYVAGRVAKHLSCENGYQELWLDSETGLILRHVTPESRQEIERIEYNPAFPGALFVFEPPPGATETTSLEPPPPTGLAVAQPVPPWSGPLLGGGELSLQELRGKPVAVYVWASWCPPCVGDPLESFERARRDLGEKVQFVTVAVRDTRESVEALVRERGYLFEVVLDERDEIANKWSVSGIPVTVLIDGDGRLVASYLGALSGDDLRQVLEALVSGRPIPEVTPELEGQ